MCRGVLHFVMKVTLWLHRSIKNCVVDAEDADSGTFFCGRLRLGTDCLFQIDHIYVLNTDLRRYTVEDH